MKEKKSGKNTQMRLCKADYRGNLFTCPRENGENACVKQWT